MFSCLHLDISSDLFNYSSVFLLQCRTNETSEQWCSQYFRYQQILEFFFYNNLRFIEGWRKGCHHSVKILHLFVTLKIQDSERGESHLLISDLKLYDFRYFRMSPTKFEVFLSHSSFAMLTILYFSWGIHVTQHLFILDKYFTIFGFEPNVGLSIGDMLIVIELRRESLIECTNKFCWKIYTLSFTIFGLLIVKHRCCSNYYR